MKEATREATTVNGAVSVLTSYTIEGIKVLHVLCLDYDHYTTLPDAVSFEGDVYGRTGWNSDKQEAYYKNNARTARETDTILAEYRERMKNHVYSAEELFEMRAAFGEGAEVVNVITGKKIRL